MLTLEQYLRSTSAEVKKRVPCWGSFIIYHRVMTRWRRKRNKNWLKVYIRVVYLVAGACTQIAYSNNIFFSLMNSRGKVTLNRFEVTEGNTYTPKSSWKTGFGVRYCCYRQSQTIISQCRGRRKNRNSPLFRIFSNSYIRVNEKNSN